MWICAKPKKAEHLKGCKQLPYPRFSLHSLVLKNKDKTTFDTSPSLISNASALNQLIELCLIIEMTLTPPTSGIAHQVLLESFWPSHAASVTHSHKGLSV